MQYVPRGIDAPDTPDDRCGSIGGGGISETAIDAGIEDIDAPADVNDVRDVNEDGVDAPNDEDDDDRPNEDDDEDTYSYESSTATQR